MASLRLEATATTTQLGPTGPAVTDPALTPLIDDVAVLDGGEVAEKSVPHLDDKAIKAAQGALSAVTQAAVSGSLVLGTGVSLALGWLVTFTHALQDLGAALFAAVLGGGTVGYALFRRVVSWSQAAGDLSARGWAWAEAVGIRSDLALKEARELQRHAGAAAGGRATPPPSFTGSARGRAQAIVGGVCLACTRSGCCSSATAPMRPTPCGRNPSRCSRSPAGGGVVAQRI